MRSAQTERLISTLHAIELALLRQAVALDKIQATLDSIDARSKLEDRKMDPDPVDFLSMEKDLCNAIDKAKEALEKGYTWARVTDRS